MDCRKTLLSQHGAKHWGCEIIKLGVNIFPLTTSVYLEGLETAAQSAGVTALAGTHWRIFTAEIGAGDTLGTVTGNSPHLTLSRSLELKTCGDFWLRTASDFLCRRLSVDIFYQ